MAISDKRWTAVTGFAATVDVTAAGMLKFGLPPNAGVATEHFSLY